MAFPETGNKRVLSTELVQNQVASLLKANTPGPAHRR
jgi:hypothetical protein